MQLCCMPSLAFGSTMLTQLRCMAGEGFALTIESPFPSLRSYDLLAHRSQIAPTLASRESNRTTP